MVSYIKPVRRRKDAKPEMKKTAALSSMCVVAMSCVAAASLYTSPEFVGASPDGKSVYVTSATGAKMLLCIPLQVYRAGYTVYPPAA